MNHPQAEQLATVITSNSNPQTTIKGKKTIMHKIISVQKSPVTKFVKKWSLHISIRKSKKYFFNN